MSNIDDMVGESITIGDDFVLDLNSNEIEVASADAVGIQSTARGMNTNTEESGLGTAVEIALGVALATVCCFLVAVLFYIRRKKTTTDDLTVLAMSAVDSKSVQPEFATSTRVGPGSVAQPTSG